MFGYTPTYHFVDSVIVYQVSIIKKELRKEDIKEKLFS